MLDQREVRGALRKLRTDKGWTPEEMADAAGVSRATIYRIEDVTDSYSPRVDTVTSITGAAGVSMAEFFSSLESGRDLPRPTKDPQSALPKVGGHHVGLSVQEVTKLRVRITRLESALRSIATDVAKAGKLAARALASPDAGATESERRTGSRKAPR